MEKPKEDVAISSVDPSVERAQGGLGVGLTLVRGIIELDDRRREPGRRARH